MDAALKALGMGPRDELVMTQRTFIASILCWQCGGGSDAAHRQGIYVHLAVLAVRHEPYHADGLVAR